MESSTVSALGNMKTGRAIDWSRYKLSVENVLAEDGGGYRMYFPTLGYAAYGVGDTVQEALDGLGHSKAAFEVFLENTQGYCAPMPTSADLKASERIADDAFDGFEYAA